MTALALVLSGPHHLAVGDWLPGAQLPAVDRIPLGVTLVLLAHGLAGRRRLALQLTLVLALFVSVPPVRPSQLILPCLVSLTLLPGRGGYAVRPDPQRLRTAQVAVVLALVVVLGRGLWVATWQGRPMRQAAYAALPVPADAADRATRTFVVVVLAAVITALAAALAAAPAPPPSGETERARVRCLVQGPDAGSLAPFVTRADRTYVFSPGGDAAIGYRVRFGVALAGGDPVGAAPGAAIAAFAELCAVHGWRPAVLGADSATGDLWRRVGVRRAVEIGDEAVLDVATFSLDTRRMRNVRQAAHRADNAGVRVAVGPLDAALVPRLAAVLHDWLGGRGERGFAMNLDAILVPRADVVVAVAHDRAGDPVAFARFALAASGRILSLDVAPRRRDAPNGVVERMIVAVVEYARTHGGQEVTLNFAGMRRLYASRSTAARLVRLPLRVLDRWIELRPLYLFTDKFHPRWRPRQLRLRSWWELVPVAAAALTAEFGARTVPAAVAPVLTEATATSSS